MTDEAPFALGGLWEVWRDPAADGGAEPPWLRTCTIITTAPNAVIGRLHDRMPVIVPAAASDVWLDPTAPMDAVTKLLVPYPPTAMHAYPMSTYVNSPRHDDPRVLAPLEGKRSLHAAGRRCADADVTRPLRATRSRPTRSRRGVGKVALASTAIRRDAAPLCTVAAGLLAAISSRFDTSSRPALVLPPASPPMNARTIALLAIVLVAPRPVSAQVTVAPQAVAQQFLNAVAGGDWGRVRDLTDPDTLWEYITKKRQDSLMPPVVAKYLFERAAAARKALGAADGSYLPNVLADVESVAQMDSLDDAELWARSLRAEDLGYQLRLAARRSGCPTTLVADTTRFVTTRTVRGVALVSETEAVALYTEATDGLGRPDDLSNGYRQLILRRRPAGWKVEARDMTMGGRAFGFSIASCEAGPPP